MADAAITFLLEDLIRILSEKAYLLSGVKEEVKSLESQLKLTQSYIRDFRPRRNDQTINVEFINQVRDVTREAEDIIDEYVASLVQQRGKNLLVRTKNSVLGLLARWRTAKEIKRVRRRIEEIFKSREMFGIQITQQGDVIQDDLSHRKRLILEETDVVGLDADAAAITERLTKGEVWHDVIAVVGMGRIGKTTLARKVYNDPVVVKHFEFRAWIYVSQIYRVRDLLQVLVKCTMGLTMADMKDMSDEELCFDLRKYLRSVW